MSLKHEGGGEKNHKQTPVWEREPRTHSRAVANGCASTQDKCSKAAARCKSEMAWEEIKRRHPIDGGMTEDKTMQLHRKMRDVSQRRTYLRSMRRCTLTHSAVYGVDPPPPTACVRVKGERMPSCWWDRIQADYRGEIRSLGPADPVFYSGKTGGTWADRMEKAAGRSAGAGVGRARRSPTVLQERALSAFQWRERVAGRVKQHVEIPSMRTNGAQALATLTPAGQLGTLFRWWWTNVGMFDQGSNSFSEVFQLNKANNRGIASLPVTFQ